MKLMSNRRSSLTVLRAIKHGLFLLLMAAVVLAFFSGQLADNSSQEVQLEDQEASTFRPTHRWSVYRCWGTLDCSYTICNKEGFECGAGERTECVSSSRRSC